MARKPKDLVFVALGGVGEIGMNLYAYGYGPEENRQWLIVDMGIVFGNGHPPAVDVFLPDISYLESVKDNIQGIIITHAHEDHMGAIPYLWEKLNVPIYASYFAQTLIELKLKETGLYQYVDLYNLEAERPIALGAFEVTPILTSHSTVEPYHLLIDTPAGKVFHSGDWKFDDNPVTQKPIAKERLKAIGDEGILLLACDSTNILEQGEAGGEGELKPYMEKIIAENKQAVYVTCFASNLARMQTIAEVAQEVGRVVIAEGASIKRMENAARENGYFPHIKPFLTSKEAEKYPSSQRLILCTGSQGEPRAALGRLIFGHNQYMQPQKGDTIIFSSKIIPGNEVRVYRLQNQLARLGVKIITDKDEKVHVSGHPNKREVLELYNLLRPRFALPIHGEYRMLKTHADMAISEGGCAQSLIAENGSLVRIASGGMEVIDEVYTGRLALDAGRVLRLDSEVIRSRTKALYEGFLIVTVAMDAEGNLIEHPKISSVGLMEEEDVADVCMDLATIIDQEFDNVDDDIWENDERLAEALRIATRRYISKRYNKKSIVRIHLIRLENE